MNLVVLIGRLAYDPELKHTANGGAVCNMRLATDKRFRPREGDAGPTADFHNIVVWDSPNRKQATLCAQYLQKGRLVCVRGRMETRSWDDTQYPGRKAYRTEVIADDVEFLDSAKDQGASGYPAQPAGVPAARGGGRTIPEGVDPDDIPFRTEMSADDRRMMTGRRSARQL